MTLNEIKQATNMSLEELQSIPHGDLEAILSACFRDLSKENEALRIIQNSYSNIIRISTDYTTNESIVTIGETGEPERIRGDISAYICSYPNADQFIWFYNFHDIKELRAEGKDGREVWQNLRQEIKNAMQDLA